MTGQGNVSSEQQEREKAGQTVRETASVTVRGAKATGDIGAAAVRKAVYLGQERENDQAIESDSFTAFSGNRPNRLGRNNAPLPDSEIPEVRDRELARSRAKHRNSRIRERTEAEQIRCATTIRQSPAKSPHKPPVPRLRDTPAQAQTAAHRANVAAQRARMLAVRSKQTAHAAARGIRAVARAVAASARAAATAVQSLAAAFVAGGAAAVSVVLLVCLIALVAGSSFGIFFAAQPTGNGVALQSAVQQLSEDYYTQIREIEQSVPHDRVEYVPDGLTAIPWQDVLSVFAADMAATENGQPVAVLDAAQIDRLREMLFQMNPVSHRTFTESHEEEQTTVDKNGKEITKTVTVTETVLEITIRHETSQDMAATLGFTARQNEQLTLLSDPQYQTLWMQLLGGYTSGGGQIIQPENVPVSTGPLQWPLPEAFPITSGFGERIDPISGEHSFHTGTDIAAPEGTPILAAANGTVTIANATDPWGGGYGYYVKIDHGNNLETLYAHCSAICVTPGQTVRQGEVIGYVGSTGESTGSHLHFEVLLDGQRINALSFFVK